MDMSTLAGIVGFPVELLQEWAPTIVRALLLALVVLLICELLAESATRLLMRSEMASRLLKDLRAYLRTVAVLLGLQIALHSVGVPTEGMGVVVSVADITLVVVLTLACVRSVSSVSASLVLRNSFDIADNLQARRIGTQVIVLSRILVFAISLVGCAVALMSFPALRNVGTSLLASAGIAGVAAGFAAKPILGNLLAGLQIAFTQPIRLDDVLIVQGEWGRVEEITATYIVLRLWDKRRLIVPLQWIIENPFQNWTRHRADLLGYAYVWVDYAMPIEPLRQEAKRICEGRREWDGQLCLVQVTDTDDKSMQVRILVSAKNADDAFDLRCVLREGITAYISEHYPQHLPRRRLETTPSAMGGIERSVLEC